MENMLLQLRIMPPMNEHASKRSWQQMSIEEVFTYLGTSSRGLSEDDARRRLLARAGSSQDRRWQPRWLVHIIDILRNPLNILLLCLCIVSYVTGDLAAMFMIASMIIIGSVLRYFQETRSERAVAALQQLVKVHATVIRQGAPQDLRIEDVVPGDIVQISAGDMVPADVRLIESVDLHADQHILTGESVPVEKSANGSAADEPLDDPRLCFQGSTIQTGYATAVVLATGSDTYFGSIASRVRATRPPTAFDNGIRSFTWLMLRIILVLVPVVFLVNGLMRGDWLEALLFATAVAVGITPEMLPMIVTVNLSKGAVAMARRKVIVKQLNAIQNLGAMDVLCTDKTGTLTQGRIILLHHVRPDGNDSEDVLWLGYLNSFFESGMKNLMDEAILDHEHLENRVTAESWTKLDEQPFDFERRRLSVLIQQPGKPPLLICKGALEETLSACTTVPQTALSVAEHLNEQGFRVVAVASRVMPPTCAQITVADESNMVLEGFLAFLDPPKDSAMVALEELATSHVDIKILTGDRLAVTMYVSQAVGLPTAGSLLGSQIDTMTDEELSIAVERTTIFAKLAPLHKERVISALRANGHVVGFLGDGINDAPALRRADVGISVEDAVDVAKESSDIILLEQNLAVLHDGVIEGRKVFGNVVKYLRMAASSNVGNMLSVVGASILLPFLPMLPVQIMLNNLLYDISQTAIPTDSVDGEWLTHPRKWSMDDVRRTILVFGPISSLFDYATYAFLFWPLGASANPALFHTGWFVESICSQMLIVFLLRSSRPPWRLPIPSTTLILTSLIVLMVAIVLPYSPLSSALGFVPLPSVFWGWLLLIIGSYLICSLVIRRHLRSGDTDR
ncbi:MAG: magnesium-translocating P-type ATPase [Candidatus Kapabacteria bacterium]|nr:magnesium-translocating P-type ATPase [Candidatus Kapabacteria bacterium]